MKRFILAAVLLTLAATALRAQVQGIVFSTHHASSTYAGGQGDVVSGAYAYYGNRAYDIAHANGSTPWVDYSCNSGSSTGTVNWLSTGYGDQATLSSVCGVSTINVTTVYDGTGNGHFLTYDNIGSVVVVLNCINSIYPCIAFSSSGYIRSSSADLVLPQPFSFTFGVKRTASFTSFAEFLVLNFQAASGLCNAANEALQFANGSVVCSSATVPDNSFNAIEQVYNDTSSLMYTNGSANPGTTAPGTGGGTAQFFLGSDGSGHDCTCSFLETTIYPSALTSTQLQNLDTNMHAAYGGF